MYWRVLQQEQQQKQTTKPPLSLKNNINYFIEIIVTVRKKAPTKYLYVLVRIKLYATDDKVKCWVHSHNYSIHSPGGMDGRVIMLANCQVSVLYSAPLYYEVLHYLLELRCAVLSLPAPSQASMGLLSLWLASFVYPQRCSVSRTIEQRVASDSMATAAHVSIQEHRGLV